MSLSMVLGTPTLGTPFSLKKSVTDCVSSPPRAIRASILLSFRTSCTFQCRRNLLHIGARRMKNGAALQLDAIGVFKCQRNPTVSSTPRQPLRNPMTRRRTFESFSNGSVDHRIQAGAIAATGQQSNSHANSPDRIGPVPQRPAGSHSLAADTQTSPPDPRPYPVYSPCKAES